MIMLDGQLFDGIKPVGVPAQLDFLGLDVRLIAGQDEEHFKADALTVSPRIADADRFISLPGGRQFQCRDNEALDTLRQESPTEGPVAWLEGRWKFALAGVCIIAAMLVTGYFWGLPAAAERVADKIPFTTEQSLGRDALLWLDQQKWFQKSEVSLKRQEEILSAFNKICSDLPHRDYYKLEFRNASALGPNAFALPGGTIVMTDAMVKAAGSTEELMAVLAHEAGHVELRHVMRSILQQSAVGVAIAAITSDAASLGAAVTGLPIVLIQSKYSREFETAADDYAFSLLKQKGYSPAAFAALMERLSKGDEKVERMFSYLASHPVTAERIKRAREAAGLPAAVGTPASGYQKKKKN